MPRVIQKKDDKVHNFRFLLITWFKVLFGSFDCIVIGLLLVTVYAVELVVVLVLPFIYLLH